jgi:hypothetical protein
MQDTQLDSLLKIYHRYNTPVIDNPNQEVVNLIHKELLRVIAAAPEYAFLLLTSRTSR